MQSAYSSYLQRMGDRRLPPMDTDYAVEISTYPTWVVELNNAIVGGLIMMFQGDRALIANVAVAPSAQGRGVGSRLLSHAETQARQRGFTELHLATHVLLTENVSLYEHLGWRETHRDETRVYMQKAL